MFALVCFACYEGAASGFDPDFFPNCYGLVAAIPIVAEKGGFSRRSPNSSVRFFCLYLEVDRSLSGCRHAALFTYLVSVPQKSEDRRSPAKYRIESLDQKDEAKARLFCVFATPSFCILVSVR